MAAPAGHPGGVDAGPISSTRNREQCAPTSPSGSSIWAVSGSSLVFDDGVRTPRSTRAGDIR
jgi:hypothetical protein